MRKSMDHPVLFLTNEAGERTGVVIAIGYYNALLKRLREFRGREAPSNLDGLDATIEGAADGGEDRQ